MNADEQSRFTRLYADLQKELKLQGKAKATTDAYSRAIRRTAEFFDRCPDDLSAEELKDYFATLLETHSWSTIKLDRCGLQFFYRHVLDKHWGWVDIVNDWDRNQNKRLKDIRKADEKRIKELEQDLKRKEKALAETAALLVLRKKAQAIWGDGEEE